MSEIKEDRMRKGIDGLTKRLIDAGVKPDKARETARETAREQDKKGG